MGKEQPDPSKLSVSEVLRKASERLLLDGAHAPTVIAEGSLQIQMAQFPDFPDRHADKAQLMYGAGLKLGADGKVGTLQKIFFISEAWISLAQNDQPLLFRPADDPNRKEVIWIDHWDLETEQSMVAVLEMMRDVTDGHLLGLRPLLPPEFRDGLSSVQSPLMQAFVDGFREGTAKNN